MKLDYFQSIFKNDEDQRVARILFKIIFALLGTNLVVIGTAMYWHSINLIAVALAASLFLLLPLGLLARGDVRLGGIFVVLIALCMVTVIATIGQGVHDIGVIAFPVIIVIASLVLPRRDFIASSVLTLGALGWLVFGEAYGVFVSRPIETPNGIDFMIILAIISLAVIAVDLLAENMRENLHQARQEIAQRKTMQIQLRDQSIHDSLTGIYNRAFFEEEIARLEKIQEHPVSIIVADLDDLKIVNDTRGHAEGDELLQRTATVLRAVFRTSDMLARIGGDEFVVLLPQTDAAKTAQMLLRVQAKLTEFNQERADFPIRLSLGAATAERGNLMQVFSLADQGMYRDKAIHKSIAAQSNAETGEI